MRLDEFLARSLAARKMGQFKDPHGLRLKPLQWRQELPEARFIIEALMAFDLIATVRGYHEERDEGE